jgi:hypothetical protein
MSIARIVYDLQAAFSSLGVFVCFWGFVQFAPCLWRVLTAKHLTGKHSECPLHASMAMICIAGTVFAFARMNTIGFFIFGAVAAGLSYIAGMIVMVVVVALSVWAQSRTHDQAIVSNWKTPVTNSPALSRIFGMLLIVTLAFIGVGLLRVGE